MLGGGEGEGSTHWKILCAWFVSESPGKMGVFLNISAMTHLYHDAR